MEKLRKKRKKGFTLIEMVVVIAIVVVIAAIAIPQALKAINKSKAATDIANARTYAGEIMNKIANNEISADDLKDASTEITKTDPAGFTMDVAKSKLLKDGVFKYKYDKANDKIEIYVGDNLVYPNVYKGEAYEKYSDAVDKPTTSPKPDTSGTPTPED